MPRISRFNQRLFAFVLTLFALFALGTNLYRSQAQIGGGFSTATIVSAATFEDGPLAPDSIAVAFGSGLASGTISATGAPLPVTLGGTKIQITDNRNVQRDCGLFFVSPGQINFLIPAGVAQGAATIAITSSQTFSITTTTNVRIAAVAPGLFTANSSGQGAATGFLLSVPQSGAQAYEPLAEYDQTLKRFVPHPLLIDRQTVQAERLFFVLYGTGIRGRTNVNGVTARIGGVAVPVTFAGAVPNLSGLDQINIAIDDSLIQSLTGRGRVNLALNISEPSAGAGFSNLVEIEIVGRRDPSLQITGFTPQRALAGETVTINGSGFYPLANGNQVRIAGLPAQVIEATDSQLKIKVPFGAESGRITAGNGIFETVSTAPLAIRTSISGVVEDTRRRPIIGVTVRAYPSNGNGVIQPLATAKTNSEGVFILPDLSTDEPISLEVDATTASTTPRLPLLLLAPAIIAGRDNPLPRPIALQIPSGAPIRGSVGSGGVFGLADDLAMNAPIFRPSFEFDWGGASALVAGAATESNELAQQICTSSSEPITLDLPAGAQLYVPCYTIEECQDPSRSLYVTQVENSRTPVHLPVGRYSSTMVQLSPFDSFITPGGTLNLPNSDCLPAGTTAQVFRFQNSLGTAIGSLGGAFGAVPGQFAEVGSATVSSDGARITTDSAAVYGGGIYFVSTKRPTATIIGRVTEIVSLAGSIGGIGGFRDNVPVSHAVVTARGQEAVTDANGAFILRNVPVLKANDRAALEVSLLRPNGRVERSLMADVPVTAGGVANINDLTLAAPDVNRPPVILASAAVAADENKRTDFNFTVSDADANQTLQVRMAGPSFAALINRGGGAYSLRLAPGFDDAGSYTVTLTAVDSLGATATHAIAVTVNNVNQAPTANAQSVAASEDTPKPITLTGADPDRDALQFTVVTKPAHGRLTGDAPDLIYTPDANYSGPDSFTFKVNDGVADSFAASVSITVAPVNDAPRLAVPAEQKVIVGQTLTLVLSATDVDSSDTLTLMAIDLPAGATFTQMPNGAINAAFAGQFSWTPTAAQTGTYIVVFTATDSATPPLSEARAIAITVTAAGAPANLGQWAQTAGPTGGNVRALFAKGSTVLAGLSNAEVSVYRSINGGDTWSPAGKGILNGVGINAFASIGNTILAATDVAVYRSGDNGETWMEANQGLPLFSNIGAVVVKGSSVFAQIGSLIYVSTDNAQSWSRAGKVPNDGFSSVVSLAASGQGLFASASFFGTGISSALYRSTDDGKTWTPIGNGLPTGESIQPIVANGNTLYAGVDRDGLYRSFDNGQNWALVPLPPEVNSIRTILFTPDTLLLGTADRLYAVARSGDTLQTTAKLVLSDQSILALAAGGEAIFAGSYFNGVFRSTDKAQIWKQANAGLTAARVAALLAVSDGVFAGTDLGFFATYDEGKTWRPAITGLPTISFSGAFTSLAAVIAPGAIHVFAGQQYGDLYRSSDVGRTWQAVSKLPGESTPIALGVNGSTIFASAVRNLFFPAPVTPTTVYRSDDLGATWTPAGNGLSVVPIAFASIGGNLFAATQEGVFVTASKGDTWRAANGQGGQGEGALPEKTIVSALAASGQNLYAGTVGRGIYVSANNGQTWTAINNYLPPNALVTAIAASGANVFITASAYGNDACQPPAVLIDGRCYGGILSPGQPSSYAFTYGPVYFSPNQGRSWAPVTAGFGETQASALSINGTNVFAGTQGRGVFVRQF